jgi:hypothetical protein
MRNAGDTCEHGAAGWGPLTGDLGDLGPGLLPLHGPHAARHSCRHSLSQGNGALLQSDRCGATLLLLSTMNHIILMSITTRRAMS